MKNFFVVLIATLLAGAVHAEESTFSRYGPRENTCGPSLTWSFSGGTLRISGTGEMNNYDYVRAQAPWMDVKDDITKVVIDPGVTSVGDSAFDSLRTLNSVTIPSTVTSIGAFSFSYCIALTSLTIPESVSSIGKQAFSVCKSLTSITIPAGVTSIGDDAFNACYMLTAINVKEGNMAYSSLDGVLFNHNCTTLIHFPSSKNDPTYGVPSGVTTILRYAFYINPFLKSVTVPAGVESIGDLAFYRCSSLTSFSVDASNTHYRSINGVLFTHDLSILIQYPIGLTDSDYIIPDGVRIIGNNAFELSKLVSIVLPDTVQAIRQEGFVECQALQSVNIPDGVTSIGYIAFYECSHLSSIIIPGSVESIGESAFHSCTGLSKLVISDGVKQIERYSFHGCEKLKSVSIPGSVESIGESAFRSCSGLTEVVFSHGISSIGKYAFEGCILLEHLSLPGSVKSIESNAFRNCSNLKSVFYQGSDAITSEAFYKCGSLSTVCVSPDYKSPSFCKMTVTSTSPLCEEFRSLFNHCFVAAYTNAGFIQLERENVSEWENQTNPCTEYYCDNKTGPRSNALITCDNPPPCHKREGQCNENNGECEYDRVDEWNELKKQENHCYELVCEGNESTIQERYNATLWKERSNDCYGYRCDNESGLITAGSCDELGLLCVNEECVDKMEMVDKRWIVEIELDGVPAIDLKLSEVERNVKSSSGLNESDFRIGYEVDDNGYVLRISIYVMDEKMANDVASAINGIEKGSCDYGVICKKTRVHIREVNLDIFFSQAHRMFNHLMLEMMMVMYISYSLYAW